MAYYILRTNDGFVTNKNDDFYVQDIEKNSRFWVSNKFIGLNEFNEPFIKNQEYDAIKHVEAFDISSEFQENEEEALRERNDFDGNFQLQELNDNSKATQIKDKRTTWSINETLTLLTAVEARYDDMHHIHKRKTFWTIISEELCSQNIEVSEAVCKKKWQNLVRTYKSRKDIKSRTGRGPVKFVFYNRLDELLGDSPTNACQHSIDVDDINTEETQVESIAQPEVENFEEHLDDPSSNSSSSSSSSKRKRKNPTIELVKIKKDFLENKMIVMKEKEESRKVYIKESLKYKEEKVRLYKDKMEMEKKKIEALISLQKVLKEKNVYD